MTAQNIALSSVEDFRRSPRFIVDPPIPALLGTHDVQIYNIGESGIQVEVAGKLQRGLYAEIRFSLPISPRVVRLEGRIAWCRQAKKHDLTQQWPYRCGVRIDGLTAFTIESLAAMLRTKLVRPDRDSLERKRRMLEERQRSSALSLAPPPEPVLPPPATLDECITRVQAARVMLRNDMSLSIRSLAAGRSAWDGGDASAEAIAIWHHLGRTVDPAIISVVLDLYPEA